MNFKNIKSPVIYKATLNNKVYIGKSINFKNRYYKHKNAKSNNYFHRAIRKHGFENVTFEILLENIPVKDLIKLETYYIDQYNSIKEGYNLRKDGLENSGWNHSKEKISKAGKGRKAWNKGKQYKRPLSDKSKLSFAKKMSGKNNPNAKKVYQFTIDNKFIKCYEAVSIAAKELSIRIEGISKCALGKRKSYMGFKWSYDPLEASLISND